MTASAIRTTTDTRAVVHQAAVVRVLTKTTAVTVAAITHANLHQRRNCVTLWEDVPFLKTLPGGLDEWCPRLTYAKRRRATVKTTAVDK
jgi:hypothetical protein